ncbi:hypothetical protein amb1504 [Paramagnetospirillum magneticum AMB-1]|uniref:Uncharacterized protein n=1 Tax=Paramagnetospirillum magneticum (strain ATCC 700264 / AMB-1) TaxID=342108 RepID=Q2W766_PARM1|nr:hypothetical protein amb1504 [Paramagnetospirillum magneticum AMB-1]
MSITRRVIRANRESWRSNCQARTSSPEERRASRAYCGWVNFSPGKAAVREVAARVARMAFAGQGDDLEAIMCRPFDLAPAGAFRAGPPPDDRQY